MALVVVYQRDGIVDWVGQRAIYLDQRFYRLLSRRAVFERTPTLARVASLGYGDELLLSASELRPLLHELRDRRISRFPSHRQLAELERVVRTAIDRGVGLAIGGDMYPELGR